MRFESSIGFIPETETTSEIRRKEFIRSELSRLKKTPIYSPLPDEEILDIIKGRLERSKWIRTGRTGGA